MKPTLLQPSEEARRLAQRLQALPASLMRVVVLQEFLDGEEPASAVKILDEVHQLGLQGGPPFNIALLTLVKALSSECIDYEMRSRLYCAAKEQQLEQLLSLFHSPQLSEAAPAGRHKDGHRELTLGHRKSLARSAGRERWEKLLSEPEPEVVAEYLRNPKVTEEDVVRLAARRSLSGEVARIIFNADRWISRYAVKRALVMNPHTPADLALRLAGFLREPDRKLVLESPDLPAAVHRAVAAQKK